MSIKTDIKKKDVLNSPIKNIIHLFKEQCDANPNHIIAIDDTTKITYQELDQLSDRVAHFLIARGIHSEDIVGLCAALNVNFIICFLGILKAGGVYFPLDCMYPQDRLQYMLEKAKPHVILVDRQFTHLFKNKKFIQIDEIVCSNQSDLNHEILPELQPENLAYLIYTSGSTGNPKGIMVNHRSIPNIALAHNDYYPSNLRMLISGGVCFDASLLVMIHALINSDTLYLCNYNPNDGIEVLSSFIQKNQISYLISVPSQYMRLLKSQTRLPFLKCVSLTGEALPKSLCFLHKKVAPQAILYNEYGPTECAIGTTIAKIYDPKINKIEEVTVGKALPNTEVYILDENLNVLPKNKKGEIYIGGIGLSRGYLNDPKLTEAKFIWINVSKQRRIRLYKTGDIGRFLSDGNLEFLGRIENVIQIQGKPVNLGEIEYHISRYPAINESAVIIQKTRNGKNRIIAYVTSPKKASIKRLLVKYLKSLMPSHMIPSSIILLDKFSLTPNGKIDKEALVIHER